MARRALSIGLAVLVSFTSILVLLSGAASAAPVWADIEQPSGSDITCMELGSASSGSLFVGTKTQGVWRCDNAKYKPTWKKITTSSKTQYAEVLSMAFDSTHGALYMGLKSRGLFCCLNAEDAASEHAVIETSGYNIYSLAYDEERDILYFGTETNGIWRVSKPWDTAASHTPVQVSPNPGFPTGSGKMGFNSEHNVLFAWSDSIWKCGNPNSSPVWTDLGSSYHVPNYYDFDYDEASDTIAASWVEPGEFTPITDLFLIENPSTDSTPARTGVAGGFAHSIYTGLEYSGYWNTLYANASSSNPEVPESLGLVKWNTSGTPSSTKIHDTGMGSLQFDGRLQANGSSRCVLYGEIGGKVYRYCDYLNYFAEGTALPEFKPYITMLICGPLASLAKRARIKVIIVRPDGTTYEQVFDGLTGTRMTIDLKQVQPGAGMTGGATEDFSVKVESMDGYPIVCERSMYFNYNGVWTGGHNVMGLSAPATTFLFAEGSCRPGLDPYLCIENTESADADVKITFMLGDGSAKEASLTVPATSRMTVVVKQILGEGDDPAHDFSAKVESTNGKKIVCERPVYFNYHNVWTGGHDIMGAQAPASQFYFAEGTCRPGFDTYFCIQNPGGTAADVKVSYMLGDGSVKEETLTVGANSRATVTAKNTIGEANDDAHDFSAKVETTNGTSIVCERPMYFNYNGVWTGGHNVMGVTAPAKMFMFAEGTCRSDFETYFCIQNPGDDAADVKITYMLTDGTSKEQALNVNPHSRATVAARDTIGVGDDASHDFSAVVETTNDTYIVCERPMYFIYNGVWTGGHNVMGLVP